MSERDALRLAAQEARNELAEANRKCSEVRGVVQGSLALERAQKEREQAQERFSLAMQRWSDSVLGTLSKTQETAERQGGQSGHEGEERNA
jgi:hypothetical protein